MLTDANFLILDEPTNHLDLDAQEALTDVLGGYDGTILFVSHDRAFIDDLATQVWLLDVGTMSSYDGNYSEFAAEKARREELGILAAQPASNGNKQAVSNNGAPQPQAKDTREGSKTVQRQERAQERERSKLQKRKQAAEARISELEETLNKVSDDLTAATEKRDLEAIVKLGTRYTELEEALEAAYAEWQRVEQETAV
jgi:ATP-binding cassette subfamily F protein 3